MKTRNAGESLACRPPSITVLPLANSSETKLCTDWCSD